jgi:hypothetical protein
MDPKMPNFSTLSYRYALAAGFSYAAELFAIVAWSRCGAWECVSVCMLTCCPTYQRQASRGVGGFPQSYGVKT